MIEALDLRKNYNGRAALDGFDLRVEEGELFGLVGPNGAGKTTLIKILATLVRASSGQALIAGHDVAAESQSVRHVTGYMPDVPGLYQDMLVREFLEFFADAFHLRGSARQAAVERALDRAGMRDRSHDFVEQLSLGWKQRLVLAKTLLHSPKVLLLDEPATGLDPLARIELRELLKSLNREGITILVSSHILSDLEDICTRVALISAGRNAAGPDGSHVVTLRGAAAPPQYICEIEVLRDAQLAADAAAQFPGARLVDAAEMRLRVELSGDPEQAAALLRHLISAGASIVRFETARVGLEERYRQAFEVRR